MSGSVVLLVLESILDLLFAVEPPRLGLLTVEPILSLLFAEVVGV